MGFTHYFTLNATITETKWKRFTNHVNRILANVPNDIDIVNGHGATGTEPLVNDKEIAFNGLGELSHETFYVSRNGQGFNFCKTAQKPYDVAVVACLVSMKKILGKGVEVSSDGDKNDLQEGIDLANGTMGMDMTFEKLLDVK